MERDGHWLGQFWIEEGETRPWLAPLQEMYEQARMSVAHSAARFLEDGLRFQVCLSPVEGEETWLERWRFERSRGYLDLADLHGLLSALRIGPHPVRIVSCGNAAEILVTRRAFQASPPRRRKAGLRPVTVELVSETRFPAAAAT